MIVHANPVPYRPASLDTKQASLDDPCVRDDRRQDRRDRRDRARRLGLRQMQRRQSVSRHARSDPDLPEERLRSEAALSGGVHRQGPAGARHRLCRVPRRRLVLPQCREGRCRHAQSGRRRRAPGRSPAASRSRAISSAASCISASTRTRPAARSMTAPGRSSPAGASRSISASPCRTACSSSTSRAAKARNGGRDAPDPVRGLPAAGILDRCTASHTCPKIIEHFGAAEVWGLKLTPEWVGTAGDADMPLPDNVRRYYIPSTQHGGGRGGFSTDAGGAAGLPERRLRQGRAARQSGAAHRDGQRACGCISATG